MFEDSLFASTARANRRRGFAAVLSFALQTLVLSIFVLVPLLYTNALPLGNLKAWIGIPPPPGRATPEPARPRQAAQHRTSDYVGNVLLQPRFIPPKVVPVVDAPEVGPSGDRDGFISLPPGVGKDSPIWRDMMDRIPSNVSPPPAPPIRDAVRLSSGVTEGLLIRKVTPVYPHIALLGHQQGSVILEATIGRDGSIENLRAVSGPPLLIGAAVDAVKQWRYRPYLLNNQPVEVETQITVNFILGQ